MSSLGAEWSMTTDTLDVARANLHAALREESEALANACEAVKTSGPASEESTRALRLSQAAHARTNAAVGEVRALTAGADRVEAAAQAPVNPLRGRTPKPDG